MDKQRKNTELTHAAYRPPLTEQRYSRTFTIPEFDRLEVIREIWDLLGDCKLASEVLFRIRLAIDEAIINAITHGHGESIDFPNTPVMVDCLIDNKSIAIRVTDTGLGFDPKAIPDPTLEENLWKITGRGIFLMRESMDEVIYNSIGNSVLMIRKLHDAMGNT